MVISCEGNCDAPSSCWKCLVTPSNFGAVLSPSVKSIGETHRLVWETWYHIYLYVGDASEWEKVKIISVFPGLQCTDKLRVTNLLKLLEYRNEGVCWNDGYTGMFDGLCYCSIWSKSYQKPSKTNKLMDLQRSYKVIAYRLESMTYNMHTIEWE